MTKIEVFFDGKKADKFVLLGQSNIAGVDMEHPITTTASLLEPIDYNNDRELRAYYYRFDFTNQPIIDLILKYVAAAGKGCHNTADWNVDLIQEAAKQGADQITALQEALKVAVEALELHADAFPYPEKIFPPLSDEDYISLQSWCDSRKFPLDRLSAEFARHLLVPFKEKAKQTLTKINELTGGVK